VAYRADIEIAVRGAQELKRLQNEVSATSKLVNQLNSYLENIGDGGIVRSINNLRDVVGRAAAAFNDAALGTDEATIAAKKYITATTELNTGLRERVELLKQITEQERKAKLAASGVRETTQYAGPIGPGQASAVALSSQLRGRTDQILAERKGAKELEQVLSDLEERRRLEANAMLDQKAASVALQNERKKEKFLAGSTQFIEPIGPGQASPVALASQLRGRTEQILAERKGRAELNAVLQQQFEAEQQLVNSRLDAKAARVQQALDKQAAAAAESAAQTKKLADRQQEFTERTEAAARAARAQTAEFIRQQRVARQMRGLSAQAPAGGFPTEGPMVSPGFTGMQRNIGRFGENLALGAGFPLLFGGGAGSVAGSILGSFVGSGFGGQILGGALGQALDQALVKIQNIGNAIRTLNFDTLTESGIRLSSEIQTQLDLLLKVGDALTAQQIVSQEIARDTGTLPGVTEDVANSVNILGDSWRKVVNAVSTTFGIIASPLAVALAGVLELVNAIFRAVNTIFSLIGKGIKTVAEFVINLVGGEGAVKAINDGIARLNSGLSEANAKAAEFRNTLNQAVVRTSIELQAAQRLTPGITFDDKLTNIRVQAQKELNLLAQDEADARVRIREENAKASQETIKGLLEQNKAAFDNRRQLVEINTQRQISTETQRQQLDQERKAAQELERQRKELERIAKLRVEQLDAAQRNYILAESEIDILTSMDPISKKQAEYDKIRVERMFTFTDLLKKALSDEEREAITQRQFLEILAAELKQEEDILNIQKQQTAELYAQLGAATLLNEETQKRFRRGAGAGSPAQERGLAGAAAIGFDPNVSLLPAKGLAAEVNAVRAELDTLLEPINQVTTAAKGIGEAFSQSFTGIVSGTMTAQEALAGFFQSVADSFLDMAAQMIAKWIQLAILNSILKLFPTNAAIGTATSGGYTLPSGAGYAEGFSLPQIIPGKATGGPVTGGMPYIVGERGPELFVPGRSGSIVPNNQLGGGENVSVVVNVDAKGTSVQGNDQQGNQLGRAISAAVQAELIKQKRPGGLLAV